MDTIGTLYRSMSSWRAIIMLYASRCVLHLYVPHKFTTVCALPTTYVYKANTRKYVAVLLSIGVGSVCTQV